jgi:hypothetical protein
MTQRVVGCCSTNSTNDPFFFSTNQSRDSGEKLTTVSTAPTQLEYKPKRTRPLKFESSNAEDLMTTHSAQE